MEQRDINSRTRADTFGLRPDIYDALSGNMVKKTDLESLLPMSGFCRLAGTGTNVEHLANKFLPFNVQKGPALGCEIHAEDGIVLNAIGMWEVKVRVLSAVSTLPAVAGYAVIRLESFDPDGNMVSREVGKVAGSGVTGG